MCGWVVQSKKISYYGAMSYNKPGIIKEEDVEDFLLWLESGVKRGWVSDSVCSIHEGTPLTDEEEEMLSEGDDPCIRVLRVWDR